MRGSGWEKRTLGDALAGEEGRRGGFRDCFLEKHLPIIVKEFETLCGLYIYLFKIN